MITRWAVSAMVTMSSVAAPVDGTVDAEARVAIVERIGAMVDELYVHPDVAATCRARLRERLGAGAFDGAEAPATFARLLTETLYDASSDRHLHVRVRPPEEAPEDPAIAQTRERERLRRENYGFERVERLAGNVGYLDFRYFSGSPDARPIAAAALRFLANVDALVIDLRRNGGGNPEMLRFIGSYLFDDPVHLGSIYWREGDRTEEYWTLAEIPGPRLADVPVFIVTGAETFSAAEGFCDFLQARKRATVVGARTRGGANPGREFIIDDRFAMVIPTGRAINPVTGTNWEGVGITPDVPADEESSLDTAIRLAREAADAHRTGAD